MGLLLSQFFISEHLVCSRPTTLSQLPPLLATRRVRGDTTPSLPPESGKVLERQSWFLLMVGLFAEQRPLWKRPSLLVQYADSRINRPQTGVFFHQNRKKVDPPPSKRHLIKFTEGLTKDGWLPG